MNRKLNIKQQVPFIVCRAAEPSGALERVKGKRVQIPHDLVTVIREPAARVLLHRSLGICPGRRRWALIFQPGNLPAVGTGAQAPDHEELVVPKKPEKTEKGLFALPSRKQKGPFCFAGHSFLYLLFSKNHVQKQERNEQK